VISYITTGTPRVEGISRQGAFRYMLMYLPPLLLSHSLAKGTEQDAGDVVAPSTCSRRIKTGTEDKDIVEL